VSGLILKWSLLQFGGKENKKILVGPWVGGEREYSKTILLFLRARAGSYSISFFLILIG
jgi:hypothetical protein